MKRFLGAMALAVAVGFSANAMANDSNQKSSDSAMSQTQQSPGMIEGKVLKASRDHLILEYQGAAVPFKVSKDTQIQGVTSIRNLSEGQQVRANFQMKDNENELKSLTLVPSSPSSAPSTPGAGSGSGSSNPSGTDSSSSN